MSCIVFTLPTVSAGRDDDGRQRGREVQELRVALNALAGRTPPPSRPVLLVDNERGAS